MTKFRKKPVVIEAFQMTKECRWDNSEWPRWLHEAWNKESNESGCLFCINDQAHPGPGEQLCIRTLEGIHQVSFDDWIIQGVQGELYPCKPDIFEQTYEKVSK
jgi:hypothetical protein